MFYFVIFNSSISKCNNPNKRILTTLLYGSVGYICFHAVLSSSDNKFLEILRSYFWSLAIIDFIACIYLYNELCESMNFQDNIFSKLLNVISTIFEKLLNSSFKVSNINISNDDDGYDYDDNFNNFIDSDNTNDKLQGILKKRRVIIDEDNNNIREYNTKNSIEEDNEIQNGNHIQAEINKNNSELDNLNKQLEQLQTQHNNDSTMSTDINQIRKRSQTNKETSLENNKDLLNVNFRYDPSVNLDEEDNLKLDNFSMDDFNNTDNNSNNDKVNTQFEAYSQNLSSMSNNIKDNFQKQMEEFNKQKQSILDKELNKKEKAQFTQTYNPNIDTASTVSANTDLGSMLDFDMDDFANTI